ncbi:sulfotransferase domain-containing protein [Sphingomonas sp. SUN019]|uniref:sulfotransferase domain-containing protein n=1 Tax=Sphingomonas sp. SUN019 TaxID=2937788 RepID=UPI002164EEA2|nr:sulfotransferase domain-containing protein [Sphingomonas sp. SUN019]UVO49841.1 sulfotransferase domain-containing protein [Sphingomonas sp. SUN019]
MDLFKRPALGILAAYRHRRLRSAVSRCDALLMSYPKSGRTWLRFILATYFAVLLEQSGEVDLFTMFKFLPNLAWDHVRGLPAAHVQKLKKAGLPLIAVTHQPDSDVLSKRIPVIFMVRDPRDVLVSSYFHATRHRHRFEGDIDEFVRDAEQGLPHLIRYLNRSAAFLQSSSYHVVSYEELTARPIPVVADLLRFLGQVPNPESIGRAVAAAEIDKMRKIEVRSGIPGHQYDRSDPEALRARRGVVGGFGDYLSQETLAWIATTCADTLSPAAARLVEKSRSIGSAIDRHDDVVTAI